MTKQLDVFMHDEKVGALLQDDVGKLRFTYDDSWLNHPGAVPISHSLPLQSDSFTQKQCQGFFGGILPEETVRKIIARNLHISERNDFSLLEKIGGECAGALSFLPAGQVPQSAEYDYQVLSDDELLATLKKLAVSPLLAGEDDIRLSLAGAQEKMSVCVIDGAIALPRYGAPSTHILKPQNARFAGLVQNEAYCLQLANRIGLNAAEARAESVAGFDYLLVERYDRSFTGDHIHRIHQEDICQALAIPSIMKYQNEGGPSLKQCFDLVRALSSAPVIDLQQLLQAVVFNFLIGNHDAHGKNFSFLYQHGEKTNDIRLAPFYDLISTSFYPELSGKMAMKIGGEYQSKRIQQRHFDKLAAEIGFSASMVKKQILGTAEKILAHVEDDAPPTLPDLVTHIKAKTMHFLKP